MKGGPVEGVPTVSYNVHFRFQLRRSRLPGNDHGDGVGVGVSLECYTSGVSVGTFVRGLLSIGSGKT